MKSIAPIIIVVLLLVVSAVSAIHFQKLIIETYSFFQELVLTLKTGQEMHEVAAQDARKQGATEGYVHLAVYTLSVIILTLCFGALLKRLRLASRTEPAG
jgi:hypothetical protein